MSGLGIAFGVIAIMAGLFWSALCFFAASMADRSWNPWKEVYLPASIGLIPIACGIWLIITK